MTRDKAITKIHNRTLYVCTHPMNADTLNHTDLEGLYGIPPKWPTDKIVLSQQRDGLALTAYTAYTGLLPVPGNHISHQLFLGSSLTATNFNPVFLECVPPWVNYLRRKIEFAVERLVDDFLRTTRETSRESRTMDLLGSLHNICRAIWRDSPGRPVAGLVPPQWSLLYYRPKMPYRDQVSPESCFPWLDKDGYRVFRLDVVPRLIRQPQVTATTSKTRPNTSIPSLDNYTEQRSAMTPREIQELNSWIDDHLMENKEKEARQIKNADRLLDDMLGEEAEARIKARAMEYGRLKAKFLPEGEEPLDLLIWEPEEEAEEAEEILQQMSEVRDAGMPIDELSAKYFSVGKRKASSMSSQETDDDDHTAKRAKKESGHSLMELRLLGYKSGQIHPRV